MEYEQRPFGDSVFIDNPENRCPVLLLLDTSGSMQGQPIRELNDGLAVFRDELFADSLAAKRVEVSIVTFGPVQTVVDFTGLQTFVPPQLNATGDTPMGRAIEQGLDLLAARKKTYRENGISFYRPWVFLITDGGPTDSIVKAKELIVAGESSKAFSMFAVGVEGANFDVLKSLSPAREPLRLQGLRFRDLFQWLSASLSSVSKSQPGELVALPPPTGWATVG